MAANNDKNMEVTRMDEEAASKAVTGDEPDAGSIPATSVGRKKRKEVIDDTPIVPPNVDSSPTKYRLTYRKSDGKIKNEISKALVYWLTVNWPDLLKVIPSDSWATMDEIVERVAVWEKAYPPKTVSRKREDIEFGVKQLVDASVVSTQE